MVSNITAKPDMYDWKRHYACPLIKTGEEYGFEHFRIENETGSGLVTSCVLFPGIQAVYNDLHIGRCGSIAEASNEVIEINYCSEGRYVCKLSDRYYFFTGHGDLSIGTVGRRESQGSFPTKRFCAITLFIELNKIDQLGASPKESLSIDPKTILKLAQTTPRYYQLHDSEELNSIFEVMIKAARDRT